MGTLTLRNFAPCSGRLAFHISHLFIIHLSLSLFLRSVASRIHTWGACWTCGEKIASNAKDHLAEGDHSGTSHRAAPPAQLFSQPVADFWLAGFVPQALGSLRKVCAPPHPRGPTVSRTKHSLEREIGETARCTCSRGHEGQSAVCRVDTRTRFRFNLYGGWVSAQRKRRSFIGVGD